MVALVTWLLAYNHLWERPAGPPAHQQTVLYNAATVCTLVLGVACMYVLLFAAALLAAVAVIPAGYLRAQLGYPVGVGDYMHLVWLATSMGTVAGALGSSLEGEDAVRRATYSSRERERQIRRSEPGSTADRGKDEERGSAG